MPLRWPEPIPAQEVHEAAVCGGSVDASPDTVEPPRQLATPEKLMTTTDCTSTAYPWACGRDEADHEREGKAIVVDRERARRRALILRQLAHGRRRYKLYRESVS